MTTALPQRRFLRLRDYNYSASGAYFVTICTQDRTALFGEIVNGEMCLNDAGRMVQDAWQNLPERFPGWDIDTWVVMPDHFHGILVRDESLDECEPVKNLKNPGGHETRPYGKSKREFVVTLAEVVGAFKSLTTNAYGSGVKQFQWPSFQKRLWQRNYYEHVIRNEQDLTETRDYITNNPQTWQQHIVGAPLVGARSSSGFTLIELIVVIVIVGILSALGGQFIVAPITGYVDLSRRARLVDQAEMALRRMQRDIRHALPNSIPAVNDAPSLTMEVSIDGGRYRRYPGPGFNDTLKFNTTDDSFEMLGAPNNGTLERLSAGIALDMVVYNTSPADTGNRQGVSSIVPVAPHIVTLVSPWQFPQASPQQRFYILERNNSSVTYTCDGSTLTRNGDLVARNVSGCEFTYDPGATQRAGLVTMRLTLEEQGEQITLLHQVHVVNAP